MNTPIRTLIVEDEIIIALDLEMTMKRHSFNVIESVCTGKEAIECATQLQPDLIMMDIKLADNISGIEAAKEIMTRQNCRIVFVTANSDPETKKTAMECNPFAYYMKPVSEMMVGEIFRKITGEVH